MTKKKRLVLSACMVAALFALAFAAYGALTENASPYETFNPAQGQGSVQDAESAEANAGGAGSADADAGGQNGTDAAGGGDSADQAALGDADKQAAPDFSMIDAYGNNVRLSGQYDAGKPVVLNFWASWCPSCKGEMPVFEAAYRELGDDVQFMMVDLVDGGRETVELGAKYIEEQGYTFPVFFDADQEGAYAYGIRSIPTTLFIGRDGSIAAGIKGAIDEKTLRKYIGLIK